jgi:AbiU2
MSEERSAAEVRAGYIRAMGRELGELFHATSSELTWIHWRWKQYRTLFGEKQSRIDLLNKAAPLFFYIVHRVLFEDTLLAIARLVGPPKSASKPNLTVERFPPLIVDVNLRDEVSSLIRKAKASAGD